MDVVGYSRLVEADELATVRAVRRLREDLIKPNLAEAGGRLVKTMGDGFLAEFESVEAAFLAGQRIQNAVVTAARDIPNDRRLYLRMGAHVGDVIVDGEDILGDGVNLAARLEGLARPGGIAASNSFVTALQDEMAALFASDGEYQVKNISRALSVWSWQADGVVVEEVQQPAVSKPPTIAVLCFANRSTDPEYDYFAEGLSEDIISALQHFGRLPVVASSSSLSIDSSLSVQDASRVLGARYLVQGAVRRAGNRIRVTVELVEGGTGHSMWAEKYDRSLEDVFEIQDDITLRVVSALDSELVEGEILRARQQRPEQLGAWEHYLRGMSHLRKPDFSELKNAQQAFLAAIEMEADYGEAWAALAWAYLKEYGFAGSENSPETLEKGYEAAKKGVLYADKSPFAHHSMSTAYVWRGEKELSLRELEHALQLNPYFSRARIAYNNRRELSDPAVGLEAAEEMRKALALSPREPDRGFYFWSIARINLVAGDCIEALDWIDRAVSVRPNDPNMYYRRAICLAALDRVDEAKEALATCDRLSPGFVEHRRDWTPYDDDRNDLIFAGMRRHNLGGR